MFKMFYETLYTVRVLSEAPIPGELDLTDVLEEANTGAYVASITCDGAIMMGAKRAAARLIEFGSEPGFFGLDEVSR